MNEPNDFTLLRAIVLPDTRPGMASSDYHGTVIRVHSSKGVTEIRYSAAGECLSLVAVDGETRTVLWEKSE
jgi:hypothetical protein